MHCLTGCFVCLRYLSLSPEDNARHPFVPSPLGSGCCLVLCPESPHEAPTREKVRLSWPRTPRLHNLSKSSSSCAINTYPPLYFPPFAIATVQYGECLPSALRRALVVRLQLLLSPDFAPLPPVVDPASLLRWGGGLLVLRRRVSNLPLTRSSPQADSLTEEQVSEFKEAFSLFVSPTLFPRRN